MIKADGLHEELMRQQIDDNPIVQRVKQRINDAIDQQQMKGIAKYGSTVDPDSLSLEQWLDHLSQELVDGLIYVECIREKLANVRSKLRDIKTGV